MSYKQCVTPVRSNLSIMELGQIVRDFALAMETVDHCRPQATGGRRTKRQYQPGIGPFGEDDAVARTVAQMQAASTAYPNARKRRYPSSRQTCDLALGELPDWAIEVECARLDRDNGEEEPAAFKKILSPYADDRSAVSDCVKLARSGFAGRQAVLIYGFEAPRGPLSLLIHAFEAVAAQYVELGPRVEAPLRELVHSRFASGGVFAWEIRGLVQTRSEQSTGDHQA
jgi:hypothetical protein